MSPSYQIQKACKDVTELSKDVLKNKIRDLMQAGFISLTPEQATVVSNAINAGVDEAYFSSLNIFTSTVETVLAQLGSKR